MGEKQGQGKPVSAGNGKKGEGEKKAKGYRQKNTGKFQTDVFKKQSEDHAEGEKPCDLCRTFLFHWFRLRSKCRQTRNYLRIQSVCVCAQSLSCVRLFATPWAVVRQTPLSVGFPRQEYQSGLSCPPPGDLPDPGSKPMSLMSSVLIGGFFITEPPGNPTLIIQQVPC